MTPSTDLEPIDSLIANAIHQARLRAPDEDVALGVIHALRVLRDQAVAAGMANTARIDDAVRAQVLADCTRRRAINPNLNHVALADPGPNAYPAREILADAARSCLLLNGASPFSNVMNRMARGLAGQLPDLLDGPASWWEIDDRLRDPTPAEGHGETMTEETMVWLH